MTITVCLRDGSREPLDMDKINRAAQEACTDLPGASWSEIATSAQIDWYDGITTAEIDESVIMAARRLIETHPDYAYAAGRLLLRVLYQDVFGPREARTLCVADLYKDRFAAYLTAGCEAGILAPALLTAFDVPILAAALASDRDRAFKLQGAQILRDRYLIRNRERTLIELPQWFWMRVAMGLALAEKGDKTTQAIAYYTVMSTFRYIPSTPTLFNSGTRHPQMSSCYLNTVEDSLEGIFKAYTDNARLSKWAGGIGTDWTRVRATGSLIKGTNGPSQGLIPWLRIDNDVAVAVNQGSKRKGAHCAYLETWHSDIENFLELRKNVGDERRRTHDINTANWIPDLFMERVQANADWTLFSPSDTPELHDLYGEAFKTAYEQREQELLEGRLPGKRLKAKDLWKKMLAMLFETGHPWITFKDACNRGNPQDHVGVIRNSNLCTEIVLNNSDEETAVCNIGSLNCAAHIQDGQVNWKLLRDTIRVAIRMLNNVIDGGFYPTVEAERAAKRHRAIGLGVMGYQDMLHDLGLAFGSLAHMDFADRLMETVSYEAISASCELAIAYGPYSTFAGSKWSRGVFPADIAQAQSAKEDALTPNSTRAYDWRQLKEMVQEKGLRNCNVLAIAPTATISHIVGVSPSIEPTYKNLYVNSSLSGEFIVINERLVRDLESRGLWNAEMANAIKVTDGDLRRVPSVPGDLVDKYPDIFALDQQWLIRAAARRGRWIDQSQSLNLFVAQPSGKLLNDLYMLAWQSGLKTTYYLRTLAASGVEKASVDTQSHGKTHTRTADNPEVKACAIDNPDCEACQ